jgi:tRNA(Ile)-lysidine synthase
MHAVQRLDSGLHLVRPLLQVRRSEIDSFLKSKRFKFRDDSSNASPEHRRNRLRHEALPLLNAIFERDVVPQVLRLGSLAEQDDGCLRRQAFEFLSAKENLRDDCSLPISPALLALHPAVLSRVFALWLREVLGLPGIEHADVDAAMEMLAPGGAAKINLPQDRHLRRKAKRLWVE